MARDGYIDQRLQNWGRWVRGDRAGGLGFASVNFDAFDDGDRYGPREAVLPEGEEAVTDQAVRSLPQEVQATLVLEYVKGGAAERKAQQAGCHLRTWFTRVDAACKLVDRWLGERRRRMDEERARVEALQRVR